MCQNTSMLFYFRYSSLNHSRCHAAKSDTHCLNVCMVLISLHFIRKCQKNCLSILKERKCVKFHHYCILFVWYTNKDETQILTNPFLVQMEILAGHLRVDEDPDEDQRDEANDSGTRTRLLRVASHCAGHAREMSFSQSTGEKSQKKNNYFFEKWKEIHRQMSHM